MEVVNGGVAGASDDMEWRFVLMESLMGLGLKGGMVGVEGVLLLEDFLDTLA